MIKRILYAGGHALGISNVLRLLGGVALFLFGMLLMGDNLKKVAGSRLEVVLYKLSSTPVKGILLGTGVTAIIQSSSATAVMVVGFVNSGMMKVRQAVGVVMGAIIGTSITGWVICLSAIGGAATGWLSVLSTENLSALIAVIGIVLRMFSDKPTRRHVGEILMGFAVLMFGMSAMSGSVSGLRSDPRFLDLMTSFSNPFIGILVGIVFTSILQSASAAVGILQALSVTGAITFEASFSLIMGIAIGAAVPVLLSSVGAGTEGKRTAWSYLVVTVIGVALFCVLFYPLNRFFAFPFMSMVMDVFSIALLNTVFRIINILLVAPFLPQVEKLCALIAKDKTTNDEELKDMDRLEERFIAHPALAVEQSRLTVNAMAQKTKENLLSAMRLLGSYSGQGFAEVEHIEGLIDRYEDKLGSYLVKISAGEMNEVLNGSVSKYLHAITDFERMSDHALNIAESAREKHEKGIVFSPAAQRELGVLCAALEEIISLAVSAFSGDDMSLAYRIEPLEEHIDGLCDAMKLHHIERIRSGVCTLEHGFVYNDLLTNFERVADHCSNIGVVMIEVENGMIGAHEYIDTLKAAHTKTFNQYYEEYSARFAL